MDASGVGRAPARLILAFVALCALEKLGAAIATGFADDEAYTLVIARQWALSYLDHPPLHQWILHAFVSAFGEGRADRLPFWLMNVATNAPLFGLTRRLFGRNAALWALFAFNSSAYFLTLPDGFIMPDAPLLLCLVGAIWAIVESVFVPERPGAEHLALWLAGGLLLGLAGLSKYSAAFALLGLAGFFLASPRDRRWLVDFRPYLGAIVGIAVFSPALIWNYENQWVSFAFQSVRATRGWSFNAEAARAILEAALGQVVSLSPWVLAPVAAGIARAARRDADSAERLMLWLAAPTLLIFALLPLAGQRAIPHWFNSGWLFAFPLAGAWLNERTAPLVSAWARASAALAALIVAIYLPAVIFGPQRLLPFVGRLERDPTAFSYDWASVAASRAWSASGAEPPGFVVVDNWRVGGRIGVGLGPGVPICAFYSDPHGFAYQCEMKAELGHDALIVVPQERAADVLPALAAYFARVDPPEAFAVGRGGRAERWLALTRAHNLLRPYPLPYGPPR